MISNRNQRKERIMIKATTLRMPNEMAKKIKDESKKLGITQNALILQILWNYLNKKED